MTKGHNSGNLNFFGAVTEAAMSETEKHSKGQTRLTANRTEMGFQFRSEGRSQRDLWTGASAPLKLLVDGERAGSRWLQQLHLLVDFGKGDVSFCRAL